MRTFQEGATMQVAMVVRDMDAAMKRHWDVFKIGPWDIYTFDATKVRDYTYRGKPATHACLIAVAWSGDTQLELMQPGGGWKAWISLAGPLWAFEAVFWSERMMGRGQDVGGRANNCMDHAGHFTC